jgi:hypothetical protein
MKISKNGSVPSVDFTGELGMMNVRTVRSAEYKPMALRVRAPKLIAAMP